MSTVHGGSDALGVPLHDFSTNANACGPCPQALAALQACDASHYPDPAYTVLRQQLADFHRVEDWRIVLAGSASEFIGRMTAWVAGRIFVGSASPSAGPVSVPPHAYGDYAMAARAWGLDVIHQPLDAVLAWACEPSSPLGQAQTEWGPHTFGQIESMQGSHAAVRVLDCAYSPLRLSGTPTLTDAQRNRLWQLWTPNKALGLTGVRGAYAIAPSGAHDAVAGLNGRCPSWPLGAHAVALLQAWVRAEVQTWLEQSRATLRHWKQRQLGMLESLGWICLPSDTNFFGARPFGDTVEAPAECWDAALTCLRGQGIKLRDARSFGLPGHVRVGVLSPMAQDALARTWSLCCANR
jgi:histidinol-phosphate aminotransferase